eukprot:5609088-Karenia_brevis.AAC.1
MTCCGKLNVGSSDPDLADEKVGQVVSHMERFGYQMHDITEASVHATSLGRVIDGQAGIVTNAPWR